MAFGLLCSYAFLTLWLELVAGAPAGAKRLMFALPGVAVCLYTPALVRWGILPRIVVGCITMWLSAFKLLAFAANRGPLARPGLTRLQQALLFLLPIHPRSPRWGPPPSLAWICCVLAGKVALQAVVVAALVGLRLHPFLVHSLWAVCIWNLVAMAVDASAPLVQYVLGMPLNPSMDQPYLSATIQEFWSHRYNLVTTTCLRQTVYEPITEAALMRTHHAHHAHHARHAHGAAASAPAAAAASVARAAAEPASAVRAAAAAEMQGGAGPPAAAGGVAESDGFVSSSSALSDSSDSVVDGDSPSSSEGSGSISISSGRGCGGCDGGALPSGCGSCSGGSGRSEGATAGEAAQVAGGFVAAAADAGPRRRGRGGAAKDRAAIGARASLDAWPAGGDQGAATIKAGPAGGIKVQALQRKQVAAAVPVAAACQAAQAALGGAAQLLSGAKCAGATAPAPRAVPEWRKSLGTLLVFVASGIMHEIIVWYACDAAGREGGGRYVLGPVLAFFTLQAHAMQAEKWVLKAAARLRHRLMRRLRPAHAHLHAAAPAPPRGAAARAARAAGRAALRAAWRAARVVMVYAWLWGLADFTFWRSTAACGLEEKVVPELVAALAALRGAAARAAAAMQLAAPA